MGNNKVHRTLTSLRTCHAKISVDVIDLNVRERPPKLLVLSLKKHTPNDCFVFAFLFDGLRRHELHAKLFGALCQVMQDALA
ncbi:hypothetical protein AB4Y42_43560, partial [Paraburkholderia sp. EG286B]|uniref:hypothetical protein n=1 Tax=Paraburkholderia sp. EG286B TaxID=3237011 RepID=UPI0034D18E67